MGMKNGTTSLKNILTISFFLIFFSFITLWQFIINVNVKVSESHSVVSDSLQPHGLYSPWNSPGQNTGVGSLSLLQGIFPIQGSNPGLSHCRWILYQLSHKGSPCINVNTYYHMTQQPQKTCSHANLYTNVHSKFTHYYSQWREDCPSTDQLVSGSVSHGTSTQWI